ncbi:unnamed protein product [Urochloa humidicola]
MMTEATGLSLGKSVLNGALSYAKSAVAEEVALQLIVQKDQAFIKNELEMMLAFLMAAHEEKDKHKVVQTWVKQVRGMAYDVEDCLQDLAVQLGKPSWWCFFWTLIDRHQVATRIKELRAKVEDFARGTSAIASSRALAPSLQLALDHQTFPVQQCLALMKQEDRRTKQKWMFPN